jgi:hypothetical protein
MLTKAQSHKLHVLFLILTSAEIDNDDITANIDTIENLVNDIPSAIDSLKKWRDGTSPAYRNSRATSTTAITDFLNTDGNVWGGGGHCPRDIDSMIDWLGSV